MEAITLLCMSYSNKSQVTKTRILTIKNVIVTVCYFVNSSKLPKCKIFRGFVRFRFYKLSSKINIILKKNLISTADIFLLVFPFQK